MFRFKNLNSAALFAIATAVFMAALFYDVLFGLGTFVIRDYSIFAYPLAHYHRECFWNGEIPLWNPYNNCGIPFLAQWSTLVLYPGSLIYLLFPMPWSLGVYCLVHLWFGGFGMFLLARQWTGHNIAAAIAGVAFGFNGFSLNCLSWPAFLASLMWMPWVIWLTVRSWGGQGRAQAWAAFAGAMQMLTGGPEVIFLTWLVVGCLWLRELVRPVPYRRYVMLALPLTVVLVTLLSAAQLLPFFDLLSGSQRSAAYADSTWSMPKWGLANLLVPLFRFYRAPNGVFFQTGQDWTSSYYPGIGVLFLAITGVAFARNFRVWLLAALSAAALLLAQGENSFAYPHLREVFPQLGFMRYPIKFMLFAAFSFPLLAAFGTASLITMRQRSPRKFTIWLSALGGILLLLALAIVLWGKTHLLPNETWEVLRNSGVSRMVLLVLMLLAFYGIRLESPKGRACAALLLLLVALDPLTHAPSQNPRVPLQAYEVGVSERELKPAPKLGETRAMLTRATHDRIYGSMLKDPLTDFLGRRVTLFGNTSLIDRIPNVDGFYSLYLQRPREAWSALFFNADTSATAGIADFMGVSQISDPNEILSWKPRKGALPLVTAGQRPVIMDDAKMLQFISSPEFNPRENVWFDPAFKPAALEQESRDEKAEVSDLSVTAQQVRAKIKTATPAIAVVAQSFDPKWKAYVDDRAVPLLRANYGFQAVEMPAGTHQLKLCYEDQSFRLGAMLSILGLLLTGGLMARGGGKYRRAVQAVSSAP